MQQIHFDTMTTFAGHAAGILVGGVSLFVSLRMMEGAFETFKGDHPETSDYWKLFPQATLLATPLSYGITRLVCNLLSNRIPTAASSHCLGTGSIAPAIMGIAATCFSFVDRNSD